MSAQCWEPGSEWALAQAKLNLASRFLVVGITEQFETFIEVSHRRCNVSRSLRDRVLCSLMKYEIVRCILTSITCQRYPGRLS